MYFSLEMREVHKSKLMWIGGSAVASIADWTSFLIFLAVAKYISNRSRFTLSECILTLAIPFMSRIETNILHSLDSTYLNGRTWRTIIRTIFILWYLVGSERNKFFFSLLICSIKMNYNQLKVRERSEEMLCTVRRWQVILLVFFRILMTYLQLGETQQCHISQSLVKDNVLSGCSLIPVK